MLKTGTADSRKDWFAVGKYKKFADEVGGGMIAVIQWGLFREPKDPTVRAIIESAADSLKLPGSLMFAGIMILLSIFEKGISLGVTAVLLRSIPKEIRARIKNSGWRQRPLSFDEIKKIDSMSGDIRLSLNRRMALVLLTVSVTLMSIMGWIGITHYFKNYKSEKTDIASAAARFAAEMVDADRADEYLRGGADEEGYRETEEMLSMIRRNAAGVNRLYVIQVKSDGCYYVFGIAEDGAAAKAPGQRTELSDALVEHLPEMNAGEEIAPLESSGLSMYALMTKWRSCITRYAIWRQIRRSS